ncbi:MAG TPA: Gfo/Idh/MocA family oxidoreductase [Panacibacter sp.]|nr:Gfo/Idh/MocA family oxidoreductase [Panacibacter sp.]HNP46526.1 Gfo/Idh/MocA family oxidoreductase [Panacibacter sp.]
MNILVIGLGSIGRRHLANLAGMGHRVSAVSSKRKPLAGTETAPAPAVEPVAVYASLERAFSAASFDAAFICSPTAFHAKALIFLLQEQVPRIYVEKPLFDQWEPVPTIRALAARYGPQICVGYDLHFEPGFAQVNTLLSCNGIGRLLSVQAFAGQYLPQWRPYEDHRTGMSAKTETGGGVLLDLIHEIDYLLQFAGNARSVYCKTTNSGSLGIETEESADLLLDFDDRVSATLHLDYLQPSLTRFATFTGTGGTIVWNLAERSVSHTTHGMQPNLFSYQNADRNDRFLAIERAFLENPTDSRLVHLETGLKSLRVVLAAKKSVAENSQVTLTENLFQ